MIHRHSPTYDWLHERMKRLAELERVVDIGTSSRFAKDMAYFESLFAPGQYQALGYKPEDCGAKTCDFDGDILALPFGDGELDGAICLEVLEHVTDPFRAVVELGRVLRPGGLLLLSTPFLTSYHGRTRPDAVSYDPSHGGYPDFWRFTHEGLLRLLLADFDEVEVVPCGGPLEVRLAMLRLTGRWPLRTRGGQRLMARLDSPRLGKATLRHFCFARRKAAVAPGDPS